MFEIFLRIKYNIEFFQSYSIIFFKIFLNKLDKKFSNLNNLIKNYILFSIMINYYYKLLL